MLTSSAAGSWPRLQGLGIGRMGEGRLEGRDAHGTRVNQRLFAVEGSRSLDVNLQVRTDEGDTVTLSIHREAEFSALSYRYKSRGEEGKQSLSLTARSFSVTQDLSVKVEGSLSDEELADIERLVQRISGSLAAGRDGMLTAASDGAGSGEFDSLSGYALDVSRSQSLEMTMVRSREWRAAPAPPATPAPAAETPPKPIAAWMLELLDRTREVPAHEQPISLTPGQDAD